MSLYEVWQSAAGNPFQPTVGKESQLFVGLSLLFIGELHQLAALGYCTDLCRCNIHRTVRTKQKPSVIAYFRSSCFTGVRVGQDWDTSIQRVTPL
jgi:hypothetical protein